MEKRRKDMKDCWAKVVVAVMMVLLLSGCVVTLSEIRTNKPFYTITSTKAPQGLAKCIEMKIRAETGDRHVVNLEEYENNTYRVALTIPTVTAIADILVKPKDNGSEVEYRRRGYLYRQSELVEIIERCAK